ncbi:hypothetical protein HBI65_210110 [Parastagonospora nodorum]|nr:hypothetical protein HBH42_167620 [Parastagonospora nodorum]KAH4962048.1 hypothetical protein HBI78_138360 [Parastagonospora nodorum]KAH5179844.1 hypothetical protein HBH77_189250 [Parastagonospora nodorum]KAH6081960.1 hypothetical protein HBI65_210110 [Parastagonospora nodorum]
MAFLRDVSSRFWNYVSPRKTQQRRDKEFKVPAVPIRPTPLKKQVATPESRDMSPKSRVKVWTVRTPSPQSEFDGNMDIDQTLLPPSPPASTKQMDDLEGDTMVASPGAENTKAASSDDEVDANEDTILVEDGNYMGQSIDVDKERERRENQGRQLRAAGWSEDAVFLFQKLGMRGFEPLLPIEWIDDLETLPEDLFTARVDKAFLRPAHGSGFRAQQALSNLFDLGGRVRDAKVTKAQKRRPEYHVKRAVQKYTTWAMKDGGVDQLWPELPLFKTVTWPKKVHSSVGERMMLQKLGDLYNQWHHALGIDQAEERGDMVVPEVPTLYGVTASHTVMAFVSYAPPTEEQEQPQLRLIAMFNFKHEGYDVWHALAMAIFVTHCRNRMMQLKEMIPEPDLLTETDPDL